MKKLIFAALLLASAGVVSAVTVKHNTVAKYDTVADKKDLGTADDKKDLGTADDKKDLGTADARKHSTTADKKDLGTAD
jgi:hypothetical protein